MAINIVDFSTEHGIFFIVMSVYQRVTDRCIEIPKQKERHWAWATITNVHHGKLKPYCFPVVISQSTLSSFKATHYGCYGGIRILNNL